jgi:hypothetical protein
LQLALLSLSSCATGPRGPKPSTVVKNEDGETMVCHQEFPTGSHIGRTVCRSETDAEDERIKARDFVAAPRPVPVRAAPPPPTGQ